MIVVLALVGCSRAVEIPANNLESVRDPKQRHHVVMKDGSLYSVRRFTVTDSTLVLDDLSPTDVRKGVAAEPIVVPRDSVASVAKIEGREGLVFGGFALLALLTIFGTAIALGS